MFVEKVFFSPSCAMGTLAKIFGKKIKWQWLYLCGFISGSSLSLSLVFLSAFGQYCAVFIARVQYYSLKSGIEIPLVLLFCSGLLGHFEVCCSVVFPYEL
jgi:hypothetical protein